MTPKGDKLVRVGVIGLGFMGATHVAAYQSAARDGFPCALVAVCDHKSWRREGWLGDVGGNIGDTSGAKQAFDPRRVTAYVHADELLAEPTVDLVSICTPTDTHADFAIRSLLAGKHVLVEKPVALRADDVRRVEHAARESKSLCMPAMCMRFWPAWAWLKDRIDDRRYGACTGLTLTRIGSAPAWSSSFYSDARRSGGAIVDLHIHDADFVRYCFGDPVSVFSAGSVNHVTTIYQFTKTGTGPVLVVAEGGWLAPGTGFRMRYVAEFEHASADFDFGRDPQLLLSHDGKCNPVEVSALSGYDEEIRHLVQAVAEQKRELRATLADAIKVAELLDAERRSLEERDIVTVQPS